MYRKQIDGGTFMFRRRGKKTAEGGGKGGRGGKERGGKKTQKMPTKAFKRKFWNFMLDDGHPPLEGGWSRGGF